MRNKIVLKPKVYQLLVLIFLGYLGFNNFLLFHSIVEIATAIIGFSILIIAFNSFEKSQNNLLLFLGVAYGFVGGVDLLHTLAYKGMGVFPQYGTNLPTQLWITARYLESISLIFSFRFINKEINIRKTIAFYFILTGLIITGIFLKIFPVTYVDGIGLTGFKIISEYIIGLILFFGLWKLRKNKDYFHPFVYKVIFLSVSTTVISELFFTFYLNVYGFSNILGHLFKLISFYLIYKAVVETSLKEPYNVLFYNLKKQRDKLERQARKDPLTGVYNRRSGIKFIEEEMEKADRHNLKFTICFIDIDGLKTINDNYGHSEGDEALKNLSYIVNRFTRESDFVSRFGGDEFLIIYPDCDQQQAENIMERVKNQLNDYNGNQNKPYTLSFCFGFAEYVPNSDLSIAELINMADERMYELKSKKKKY